MGCDKGEVVRTPRVFPFVTRGLGVAIVCVLFWFYSPFGLYSSWEVWEPILFGVGMVIVTLVVYFLMWGCVFVVFFGGIWLGVGLLWVFGVGRGWSRDNKGGL